MVLKRNAIAAWGRNFTKVALGAVLAATLVGMPAGIALAKATASAPSPALASAPAKKAAAKGKSKKQKVPVTKIESAADETAVEVAPLFARPSVGVEMDGPVLGATAAKIARECVGCSYVYGGTSPLTGFDCSGLTQYTYKQAGVSIWRTAQDQYGYCKKKSKNLVAKDDIVPGDLLFFGSSKRAISHVGLYLGNDKFVHAVKPGSGVKVTRLSKRTNWVASGRPYKD